MKTTALRWGLPIGLSILFCVLGLWQTSLAAPKQPQKPFVDAGGQRSEIVQELRQIQQLLREQNALLRSGKLQVVVAAEPASP